MWGGVLFLQVNFRQEEVGIRILNRKITNVQVKIGKIRLEKFVLHKYICWEDIIGGVWVCCSLLFICKLIT